jgi:hypothetical protein
MGCDIHTRAEKRVAGKWTVIDGFRPFDWRDYRMYGFLADVRNYSAVPPIAEPRGLPSDMAPAPPFEYLGDHTFSWLSVKELASFDYDSLVEDRRCTVQIGPNAWDGGATAAPGAGWITTYREFLGRGFFDDIEKLKAIGAERIDS